MSDLFKLNMQDLLKGAVITFITSVLTAVLTILEAGGIPDWAQIKVIVTTGLIAGVSYLLKNFLTDSQGKLKVSNKKQS